MKLGKIKLSRQNKLMFKHHGRRAGNLFWSLFRLAVLISIGYIVIYPLFYMIVTSVQSKYAFLNSARIWIPSDFDIAYNFKSAVKCLDYFKSLWSTVKNQVFAGIIQVFTCAVTAYGFARFEFREKKIATALLFLTIMIPDMMLLIPRMINYSQLDFCGILGFINKLTDVDLRPNILGSPLTFWLPAFFGVGIRSGILIYIFIQFFKGLPRELEEAAYVDGAGPIRTFISIALPSSKVVMTTVFILSLIWHYNDSFLSGLYLPDEPSLALRISGINSYLFEVGLEYSASDPQSIAVVMASCLLYVLPILVVYMILQKNFIESIDRVGITG